MYLTKVIEMAKALQPDEFSVEEYIAWCNELSCDLSMNYNKEFKVINGVGSDEILLPEGVDIYMIEKITADGLEIKKTDVYDYANRYVYLENGRCMFKMPRTAHNFEIVYQVPYANARYIDKDAEVIICDDYFNLSGDIGLCEDDILTITDLDTDLSYEIQIEFIDNIGYYFTGDEVPDKTMNANITRHIVEKTVAQPPYDYMYIDYLIGKSKLYAGDSTGYKNHMAAFALKLDEYSKWLASRRPIREKKLINWY